MQYIENDMDDTFKKAGEDYPLRTDGSDWESIQARLTASDNDPGFAGRRRFNRNYLWLLLLLTIPGVYLLSDKQNKPAGKAAEQPGQVMADHRQRITGGLNDSLSAVQGGLPADGSSGGNNMRGFGEKNKETGTHHTNDIIKEQNPENNLPQASTATLKITQAHRNAPSDLQRLPTAADPTPGINQKELTDNGSQVPTGAGADNRPLASPWKEEIPVDSTTQINYEEKKMTGAGQAVDTGITARVTAKALPKSSERKGWYVGILAGPDVSTIKSQKVKNLGYNAGVLVGYRISAHWAVETGAFWDRKKYFTDGKYFDKAGAGISPAVMVHYLDGGCDMIEIPLAIRYDLRMKKNSVFATAGMSSYLMKKEQYEYGAVANGTYYEGKRSYLNAGNFLFANLHLSAGYNYNLSSKLSLRIEPFIKLPVKNIGVGKMPVSSKGVYVGISRTIR